MARFLTFLALLGLGPLLCAQNPQIAENMPKGTWILKDGKKFVGNLMAADGLRATFRPPEKPKFVISLSELDPKDADEIRAWRGTYFRAPMVDPDLIAKWPQSAGGEKMEVQAAGEDGGYFSYDSPNFHIVSDLRLPLSAVRDLATVFESTRAALISIPLGLHAGGERERYPVMLYGTAQAYAAAGGLPGSGGMFDARTRRMLVLLPNIGIEQKGGSVRLNYGANLFILKHEVTHQLLSRWHGRLPMWLSEGLAEFVASLPYAAGKYNLQNPASGLRDYITKWRRSPDDRGVTLVNPGELMDMDERAWRKAVALGQAYDLYNTSGLLTWYFMQIDEGKPFARYLDALRHGDEDTEKLLMGKLKREALPAELAALAKKIGLDEKKPEKGRK